jgi:hypothetical protein
MGEPQQVRHGDSGVSFIAPGRTDFFRDPASREAIDNAPYLYRDAPSHFTFSTRVVPGFASRYDAGAILCYRDPESWVKLAYEYTDLGYPAIVSVATRGRSDDCNGEPVSLGEVWLKVSRRESLLGLYYSFDGEAWKMHRLLQLPGAAYSGAGSKAGSGSGSADASGGPGWRIGVAAQSPTGDGCPVDFRELSWSDRAVDDFRKG